MTIQEQFGESAENTKQEDEKILTSDSGLELFCESKNKSDVEQNFDNSSCSNEDTTSSDDVRFRTNVIDVSQTLN